MKRVEDFEEKKNHHHGPIGATEGIVSVVARRLERRSVVVIRFHVLERFRRGEDIILYIVSAETVTGESIKISMSVQYHLYFGIGCLKAYVECCRVIHQNHSWTSSCVILQRQWALSRMRRTERAVLENVAVEWITYRHRAFGAIDCDHLKSDSLWKHRSLSPVPVG